MAEIISTLQSQPPSPDMVAIHQQAMENLARDRLARSVEQSQSPETLEAARFADAMAQAQVDGAWVGMQSTNETRRLTLNSLDRRQAPLDITTVLVPGCPIVRAKRTEKGTEMSSWAVFSIDSQTGRMMLSDTTTSRRTSIKLQTVGQKDKSGSAWLIDVDALRTAWGVE